MNFCLNHAKVECNSFKRMDLLEKRRILLNDNWRSECEVTRTYTNKVSDQDQHKPRK